jgi:hypothetical protein
MWQLFCLLHSTDSALLVCLPWWRERDGASVLCVCTASKPGIVNCLHAKHAGLQQA